MANPLYAQTNTPQTEKRPNGHISQSINIIIDRLGCLEECLSSLKTVLEPILAPVVSNPTKEEVVSQANCKMAQELSCIVDRIDTLITSIKTIENGLEI